MVALLAVTILLLPVTLTYGLAYIGGSPTNERSLASLGGSEHFKCEWTNGHQAVVSTSNGHLRLVNTRFSLEVNKTYYLSKPTWVPKKGPVGEVNLYEVK